MQICSKCGNPYPYLNNKSICFVCNGREKAKFVFHKNDHVVVKVGFEISGTEYATKHVEYLTTGKVDVDYQKRLRKQKKDPNEDEKHNQLFNDWLNSK